MHLKKSFRKGFHIFTSHKEETTKDTVETIEDHPILRNFEYVFGEIIGFPPKRDIKLSIDLVLRDTLVSMIPYIMGTLKLKEL
jgi:hypothetical protein